MAGTLVITTLSDGTNSTSATNCIQGSAKAWVNFNGSSAAIRSSYNFSSITKNGTGLYTANLTNAAPSTNVCWQAQSSRDGGSGNQTTTYVYNTPSASNVSVGTTTNPTLNDNASVFVAAFWA